MAIESRKKELKAAELEVTRASNWPQQASTYIDEVRTEMKRVSWPSWASVRSTTGVVIAAVFLFAAYFYVVDVIVNAGITRIIDYFTRP